MQDNSGLIRYERFIGVEYSKKQTRKAAKMNNRAGFSLMELMVTIAIIAVLASIRFSVAIPLIKRANDTNCVSNLRTL